MDSVVIVHGLHIDIPATELKALLRQRLAYHENRAAHYTRQLEIMQEAQQGAQEEARSIGKGLSSSNPLSSLEDSLKSHQNATTYYKFMADHVIENATYRLSEADLTRIGISQRY